jgi:predicted component of type VI protein secretion system
MATLVVQEGPLAGHRLEIAGEVLIGRENATLLLDDPEVSRRHAVIRPRGEALEVEDLGSLNGTWVNGHRVTQPTPLAAGDAVRVGSTTVAVELVAPPVPMDPAAAWPSTAPAAPAATTGPTGAVPPAPPGAPPPVQTPPFHPPSALPPQHQAAPQQAFQPPPQPVSRMGPATRGVVAIAVTFATIAVTAILLVVYFATRTSPP